MDEIDLDYSAFPFAYSDAVMGPRMYLTSKPMIRTMKLFDQTIELGDQDRMALLCSYRFSDWNH